MASKKQIPFFTNIIPPYRVSFGKQLDQQLRKHDRQLVMLTCDDSEPDRDWKVQSRYPFAYKALWGPTLIQNKGSEIRRILHIKPEILAYLFRHRKYIDKVVIGDAGVSSYLAAISCHLLGIPYIWWSEINGRGTPLNGTSHIVRKWCVQHAQSSVACGVYAKEYLLRLGVSSSSVLQIPNFIDEHDWFPFKTKTSKRKASTQFLYVGRFVESKHIPIALDIFEAYLKHEPDAEFHIVGAGPQQAAYESLIAQKQLPQVHLHPFQQSAEELAQFYQSADFLFLLGRPEAWGLVVNEAMVFDVKCILATTVGALGNLIDLDLKNYVEVDLDHVMLDKICRDIEAVRDVETSWTPESYPFRLEHIIQQFLPSLV